MQVSVAEGRTIYCFGYGLCNNFLDKFQLSRESQGRERYV